MNIKHSPRHLGECSKRKHPTVFTVHGKAEEIYYRSVCVLLVWTAGFKLATVAMGGHRMQRLDPLLHAPTKYVLIGVGLLEVGVALHLICTRHAMRRALALLWFSFCLLGYRLLLWYIDPNVSCNCFGFVTELIQIKGVPMNWMAVGVLSYFSGGSILTLMSAWREEELRAPKQNTFEMPSHKR